MLSWIKESQLAEAQWLWHQESLSACQRGNLERLSQQLAQWQPRQGSSTGSACHQNPQDGSWHHLFLTESDLTQVNQNSWNSWWYYAQKTTCHNKAAKINSIQACTLHFCSVHRGGCYYEFIKCFENKNSMHFCWVAFEDNILVLPGGTSKYICNVSLFHHYQEIKSQ